MTIRTPKLTLSDRLLKALGKKRGIALPEKTDPYAYQKLMKESFWKALLRPAGKDLPPGYTNIFDLP